MEWQQWPRLPLAQRERLPSQPGIYVVVDAADQVWYVGLSKNLHARWNGRGHHRYRQLSRTQNKRLYQIHWQFCPLEQLAEREQHLLSARVPKIIPNGIAPITSGVMARQTAQNSERAELVEA